MCLDEHGLSSSIHVKQSDHDQNNLHLSQKKWLRILGIWWDSLKPNVKLQLLSDSVRIQKEAEQEGFIPCNSPGDFRIPVGNLSKDFKIIFVCRISNPIYSRMIFIPLQKKKGLCDSKAKGCAACIQTFDMHTYQTFHSKTIPAFGRNVHMCQFAQMNICLLPSTWVQAM